MVHVGHIFRESNGINDQFCCKVKQIESEYNMVSHEGIAWIIRKTGQI